MIFRILAKNVANITKAALYLSRLTICQKKCFGEKEFNTCGFSGKISYKFGGKVSKTNFRGIKLCKKGNSNLFLTLGEKVSNFSPKFPSRAVSTAFYVSKGWILGKKTGSIQFSDFLGHRAKLFEIYAKSFFAGLSIMHFTRPKKFLGKISVWNLRFTFTEFKR